MVSGARPSVCSPWILLGLAWVAWSPTLQAGAQPAAVPTAPVSRATPSCEEGWAELSSIRRLQAGLRQQLRSGDPLARAGAWTDLATMAEAVVGPEEWPRVACGDTPGAAQGGMLTTPAMASRDRLAYGLLALGYSAREVADVVSGRISRAALDMARRLIMTGRGRDEAAAYLDAQYRQTQWAREVEDLRARTASPIPSDWDPLIEHHAREHGVSADLVRAVIQTESAFIPFARSRVGAAGLMQLMPATARELGVNPWIPEQNVEGGVRYLSGLLREFGTTELALIAYNGGPGFARRYVRGEAALYGETREYVRRVSALLRSREPATLWR